MEESAVGTLMHEIVNVTMNGNEVALGDQFLPFLDSSGSLVFKGVIDLNGSVYFDTSQFANYVIEQQQITSVDEEQHDREQIHHNGRVIEKSIDLKNCDNNSNQIDHNDAYLRGPNSTVIVTTTLSSCPSSYHTTSTSTFSKQFQDISTVPSSRSTTPSSSLVIGQQSREEHHEEEEQLVPVPEIDSNAIPSQDPLDNCLDNNESNNVEPPIGKGPFRCTICSKIYTNWPQFRRHKKEHLDEKIYRCEKCPMTFNYEHNLSVHLLVHEAETSGCLRCKLCSSKFSRLASLKSHLRVHEKEDNLVCQECGDEFPTKARLENHLDEHKPKNTRVCLIHRCRLCGKTFTKAILLKAHSKEHAAIRSQLKSLNTRKRKAKPKSSKDTSNNNSTEPLVASTSESAVSKVDRKKKRVCIVCNKRFQKPSQLARHERIHTGEKPFECKECGKRFNQKGTMESHIQAMHKREKPYGCDLCSCKFSQRGNLKAHVLKVHVPPADNEKVFRCEECCCVYRRLATLNNHIAKVHAVESTQMDEDIVNGPSSLLNDRTMDGGTSSIDPTKRPLQNVPQNSMNISSGIMSQHSNRSLHQQQQGALTGGLNSKVNSAQSTPVGGANVVSAQPPQPSMARKETLGHGSISEIKIVHTEQGKAMRSLVKVKKVGQVKWHLCPYCQKAFRKPSDLIRHIRVHTQERPYTCNICGKSFAVKSTLNTHVRTHCPNNKELECRVCHKRFSMLSSLKSHERLHTGVKPFACMQCGKAFRTSSQRRVHFKIHSRNLQGLTGKRKLLRIGEIITPIELPDPLKITSDGLVPVPNRSASAMASTSHSEGSKFRPYKCKDCPSAFKKSSHLKQHIRSHTGEKPYKCFQCFRSFVSSGVLKNHIKTHEKVRAFKCSVCTMSFTTNGSLTRHMATGHNSFRAYVCPYCHKTFKTSVSCRKHIKTHRTEIVAAISGNNGGGLTTVTTTENDGMLQDHMGNTSTTIHSGQHGLFDDHCPFDSDNHDSHYDDYASTVAAVLNEGMNQPNIPLLQTEQIMAGIQESHHHQSQNLIPMQHQQLPMNDSIALSRPPPPPLSEQQQHVNNIMQDMLQNSTVTHSHEHNELVDADSSVQLHYQIPCTTMPMHPEQQNSHIAHHSEQHHHHQMSTLMETQHVDPSVSSYNSVYGLQEENVELNPSYMSQNPNDGVLGGEHIQTPECIPSYHSYTSAVGGNHPSSQEQQHIVAEIQNELDKQVESTTTTTQGVVVDVVPPNTVITTVTSIPTSTNDNNNTLVGETAGRNECQSIHVADEVQRIRETSRPISERIYNELTSQPSEQFRKEEIRLVSKMNECQFCLRAFKKRSDLQRHERIHTGEKPFRCNVCARSFRVKSTREAHMRTHEGGKTVSCHVCNNLFSTKSSLRVHMRLHTGTKPYPCDHCDLSFRTSGHRKAHVASHFKSTKETKHRPTSTLTSNQLGQSSEQQPTQYLLSDIVAIHSTQSPDSSIPVPVVISNDNNNGQLLPSMIHTLAKDKQHLGSSSKLASQEELDIAAIAAACENMNSSPDSLHVLGNVQLTMDGQTIQLTGLDLSSLQVDDNFIQNLANVIFIPSPSNGVNNNSVHDHYDATTRVNVVDMAGNLSSIPVVDAGSGFAEMLTGKDVNVGDPVNIIAEHQEEHGVSDVSEMDTLSSTINSGTIPNHHHEQILSSSTQSDELDQYIGESLSSSVSVPPSSTPLPSNSNNSTTKNKRKTTNTKKLPAPNQIKRTSNTTTSKTASTSNKCCSICSKTFAKPSLLSRHMRTHTGERPYKCELCNRSFSQQTSLSAHLFTHTNEKPFVCSLCPFKTVKKGALKTHFQKAHPEAMDQFEIMFSRNTPMMLIKTVEPL